MLSCTEISMHTYKKFLTEAVGWVILCSNTETFYTVSVIVKGDGCFGNANVC